MGFRPTWKHELGRLFQRNGLVRLAKFEQELLHVVWGNHPRFCRRHQLGVVQHHCAVLKPFFAVHQEHVLVRRIFRIATRVVVIFVKAQQVFKVESCFFLVILQESFDGLVACWVPVGASTVCRMSARIQTTTTQVPSNAAASSDGC